MENNNIKSHDMASALAMGVMMHRSQFGHLWEGSKKIVEAKFKECGRADAPRSEILAECYMAFTKTCADIIISRLEKGKLAVFSTENRSQAIDTIATCPLTLLATEAIIDEVVKAANDELMEDMKNG